MNALHSTPNSPPVSPREAGTKVPARLHALLSIRSIVAIYWILGTAWIVGSDAVVTLTTSAAWSDTGWNILKGIAFVSVTAALLYPLLRRREVLLDRERERSEALAQQLADSDRMDALGRLAGGIGHDFNNLLTVIGGHTELLRADAASDCHESLDAINAATHRAQELTTTLLSVARRDRLSPDSLDVADLVRRTTALIQGVLAPGIECVLEVPDTPVVIRADEHRFEQVVMNLARNGSDAMANGGTLQILLHAEGQRARFSVSDTGKGMTTSEQRHCFEPFYTTKPAGQGTGLGLSLVYGTVRDSGGEIRVRSELGVGSTFEIDLPLVDGATRGTVSTPASG